ncbi:MAG TPA: MFS transporter [Ferruginibacter sp.]|nr:MFS transporter [Ferruginibacter sp.]
MQTKTKKIITRTIWILSLVSLFTDMASEMLYPIMPLYLKQIGYTALFIGILEGFAEAIAGLSKSFFGKLSDRSGKRLPFVQLGYGLSAISKPMLAFFIHPLWIFSSRTIDRLGKGIRTGARDALLSDEATPATKGTVFGFHRSMDTLGAVLGPSIALIYLYFYPNQYQTLFLLAFLPGVVATFFTLLIKEKSHTLATVEKKQRVSFFSFIAYWKNSSPSYKKLLTGLLLFALVNSSDVFLLLKMKENGIADTVIIGLYIFYNLVYAIFAYPIGRLADKWGLKKIFITGLFLFSLVYAGFTFAKEIWVYILLLVLYGIYAAATEGIAKAWISNITAKTETATAIGTYSGFQSIAALFASSMGGLVWFYFGSVATFATAAVVTIAVIIYLQFSNINEKEPA